VREENGQPCWRTLLDVQRRGGFPDLAGSEGRMQVALSDVFLSDLVATRLPAAWPVRQLTLHALGGDEIAVRVRPRSAWLPPLQLRVTLEPQPVTAATPYLRARVGSSLGRAAAVALGSAPLPGWVRLDQDYVTVDVQALATQLGVADLLSAITTLTLRTEPGRVVTTIVFAVRPPALG
jgi:hypothetical protein